MTALTGLNVLLVEDEFLIAMDAEQALRDLGAARIDIASTLSDAEALAGERRFDVAVLDVNLNGQMSFPVAEKFRRDGVPVVFATGYDLRDRPPLGCGHGVCVEKPYTSERLRDALCAALAGARTVKAAH